MSVMEETKERIRIFNEFIENIDTEKWEKEWRNWKNPKKTG